MPPQEKNIKGFSILELLVVLALVAIISGAAYPNFSEWNKERAVRSDVDKIAALIKNTYTQTERGALAYVQIYFNQTSDGLFVEGRGLTMSTLATKINNGDDDWNDIDKIGEKVDSAEKYTGEVYFFKGSRSEYIMDSDKDLIQKLFPKAKFINIQNAGHWLHADNPNDFLSELLSLI